jgi:hypothetical protein
VTRAFVIRPFDIKKNSAGREIDFERVHGELIQPALDAASIDGGTTGLILDSGNIRADMFALILEADVVIADITVHNANVFYELGLRHAFRKRSTLMIRGADASDTAPFDLSTDRYFEYNIDDPASSIEGLVARLRATLVSDRPTDSPVFQLLPALEESDPSQVTVVPLDFTEEVARARNAKARGWLRLLAEELEGQRFQVEGLRMVAAAQWALKDYEAARDNWEAVLEARPGDVDANLALANIYERLHGSDRPGMLAESDQAIARVLDAAPDRAQRAEALSLKGRNLKSRWREEFAGIADVAQRRETAMSRALVESFEAYRAAFNVDLNHFYPGLAALQMGSILLDLSSEATWADAFDTDEQAASYRVQLEETIAQLRTLVGVAVENASGVGPDDVWARITRADVLFVGDPERAQRVISAYDHAIPVTEPFAWDAAKRQLELFRALGVRAELAGSVIAKIDEKMGGAPQEAQTESHLIVFAGHRIDEAGRTTPRFPSSAEATAQEMIRAAIVDLAGRGGELRALASAAPGADILALEVFAEVGIPAVVCLPMPSDEFARQQFADLDDWRNRYLDIVKTHQVMTLSDRPGLPRWLQASGVDPWERGNEWVIQLAETSDADQVTVLVFWDGQPSGSPGGTGHMVDLARKAGRLHVKHIDSTRLLTE